MKNIFNKKTLFTACMMAFTMGASAQYAVIILPDGTEYPLNFEEGELDDVTCTLDIVSYYEGQVDLGLPSGTIWSDVNFGASHETSDRTGATQYGGYYAWMDSEQKPKKVFTEETFAIPHDSEEWKWFKLWDVGQTPNYRGWGMSTYIYQPTNGGYLYSGEYTNFDEYWYDYYQFEPHWFYSLKIVNKDLDSPTYGTSWTVKSNPRYGQYLKLPNFKASYFWDEELTQPTSWGEISKLANDEMRDVDYWEVIEGYDVKWEMPTQRDFEELMRYCTVTTEVVDRRNINDEMEKVKYLVFTSNINGNVLKLECSGQKVGSEVVDEGAAYYMIGEFYPTAEWEETETFRAIDYCTVGGQGVRMGKFESEVRYGIPKDFNVGYFRSDVIPDEGYGEDPTGDPTASPDGRPVGPRMSIEFDTDYWKGRSIRAVKHPTMKNGVTKRTYHFEIN